MKAYAERCFVQFSKGEGGVFYKAILMLEYCLKGVYYTFGSFFKDVVAGEKEL